MSATISSAASAVSSARAAALDGLAGVLRHHRSLDLEIPGLDGRDRAFARLLTATTLRRLGQIDTLLARCLEHPLPAKTAGVRDVLRLGAAQLLFLDIPPHAVVDTAVDLCPAIGFGGHRRLVNAVLRRLAREGRAWAETQDAPRLNTPDWLWAAWSAAHGEETCRAIAAAHLSEAPLDLTAKDDPATWAARLGARLLPTGTLRCPPGGPIPDLPGFAEGAWWVQDAAAALPARLLGDLAGRQVADLCAAPGGKTAQLAAAGAIVTALDRAPRRLDRLAGNLSRLGLSARLVVADAVGWRPDEPLDAILLDAPCSATGTLRRHPDALYLKRPEDISKLAVVQDRLLHAAAGMLRPGGRLVYCVCSLQPEEGPARIDALLAAGVPLVRRPIAPDEVGGQTELITPQGDLRTLPCHLADWGGLDGFYAARLERP